MANGKQNTVRILQSTRKNNLPPAVHAAVGFVAGSAFIGIVGWMYLTFQAHENAAAQPKPQPEFQAPHLRHAAAVNQEAYAGATGISPPPALATEAPEAEDGRNFDTDLTNAFKHAKADVAAPKPEIEIPRGSVQMTVTQTLAPAKEAASGP